jgi:hypothetical protein
LKIGKEQYSKPNYGQRLHDTRKKKLKSPPEKFLSSDFISSYEGNRLYRLLEGRMFENLRNELGGLN